MALIFIVVRVEAALLYILKDKTFEWPYWRRFKLCVTSYLTHTDISLVGGADPFEAGLWCSLLCGRTVPLPHQSSNTTASNFPATCFCPLCSTHGTHLPRGKKTLCRLTGGKLKSKKRQRPSSENLIVEKLFEVESPSTWIKSHLE